MRDKIAELIEVLSLGNYGGHVINSPAVADAIIAALPDMVKPLEWEDWSSGHRLNYASVKNGYVVAQMFFPETYFRVTLRGNTIGTEETPEAAQAAAQAHHVAQALAPFDITPPDAGKEG